jgi:FOG: Ankyrin repeat
MMRLLSLGLVTLMYIPVMAMELSPRWSVARGVFIDPDVADYVNKQDEQGRTPLHHAIIACSESNKLPIIETFLRAGADVSIRDNNGRTPFHYATEKGYEAIVKALLRTDAHGVGIPDNSGMTPMLLAALYGHAGLITIFLDVYASLKADNSGMTPLHLAAQEGHLGCVKALVKYQPLLINIPNERRETPLHVAIFACRYPVVKFLLENGADPLAVNSAGQTLLHYAVMQGMILASRIRIANMDDKKKSAADEQRTAIIDLLLRYGVGINRREKCDKRTPLHYAVINGDLASVVALLRSGADVNVKDAQEATPLHLASRYGQSAVAQKLIEAGATVAVDHNHKNPLHYVAENGRTPIAIALLAHNPQLLDVSDAKGMTPLLLAVRGARYSVVKLLLGNGANSLARDAYGRVSFHYAAAMRDEKMMKLLTCRSLDCIFARDKDGKTPLEYADEVGHLSADSYTHLLKSIQSLVCTPYRQMFAFLMGLHPKGGADSPIQLLLPISDRRNLYENPVICKITKLIKK